MTNESNEYPRPIDPEMRVGATTGLAGTVRGIGWSLEHSGDDMMRASKAALADGDSESAVRRHIIAVREYYWASRIYEALGMDDDYKRVSARSESAKAGTWTDSGGWDK